jgi:5-methylthioadenosine/S-adenosylhomocysteine deaminase
MATREAARALHLEAEIGTLTEGKRADVVVVDLQGWSLLPDGDPAARVVYGATARDVRHVVVDGRPVVVDRRLTTADEDETRTKVRQAWQDTRGRMMAAGWTQA